MMPPLFEDSKDAIFISTPDGKLADMNPAGLTLFGRTQAELSTINVQDFYVNADDRRKFRAAIEPNGEVTDYEIKMQKGDGSQFDALITATLRHGEDDAFAGYQGIIRDITVRWRDPLERRTGRRPSQFFTPPHSAYTAQTPRLFSDTLVENLLMGQPLEQDEL